MEAAEGRPSLGGSIPVQSVQALAASLGDDIPATYVRPEVAEDFVGDGDSDEIPAIDMGRLLDPELELAGGEAAKLHRACEEWGFFQLINHGISDEVIEQMKIDVMEFFQLPLGEKDAVAQLPDDIEGYGQAFVVSEDQKLDWGDMFFLTTQPLPLRKMRFWPTHPPTFRDTIDKYSEELKGVANCLIGFIAKNLGLDPPEKLTSVFKEGTQSMRMNYYPPSSHADKVLGLSSHSDAVGLTLLLQVNDVPGLQIRRKGGWLTIKPFPHAFIVNIGDVLEIMSNGRYKSIEHRVIVDMKKERLSIAGFHTLNYGDIVGPIAELVSGSEEYYKSLTFENYMRQLFASKLEGKSILDQMRLMK